ncbi:MAG: hypothetical protein QME57_04625 [Patescibacteria group bacterium]|nr:hypothetical protein [Patescibacteria group bacterium]
MSKAKLLRITIRNNLDESIFSHAASISPVFSIKHIERKKTNGSWEKLFAHCQYPHCMYKIDIPREIKPNQSVTFEWKPLIYINGTRKTVQVGAGVYRLEILYQIRRGSTSKSWEWKTVYSNEFTIK